MVKNGLRWLESLIVMMVVAVVFTALAARPGLAQSLPTITGTASEALTPADWLKIGGAFGSRGQWQFGLDKSATAGSCAAYAVRAHLFMAGPCRDLLLLARDQAPVFLLGAAILYSPAHSPAYIGRLGATVGPVAGASLDYAAKRIPYLESLTDMKAPRWAFYLGKITTVDYFVGSINGRFDHGPEAKVNIPLTDLKSLLPGF